MRAGPEIRVDDLSGAETQRLVARHLAGMHDASPAESVHALDLAGLRHPSVTFWSAWIDGELAGMAALKALDDADAAHPRGEITSMRVDERFLGRGVGRALLEHLIDAARGRGYASLWLETGTPAAFAAAQRLYARAGFAVCGPFGAYREDPESMFMTLALGAASPPPR